MLSFQEKANQRKKVEIEAQKVSTYIAKDIDNRIKSLNRIVSHWDEHHHYGHNEFLADTKIIISDLPGFQAIEWVDTSYHVRWIVPFDQNKQAIGIDSAFETKRKKALEKAKKSKTPTLSGPVNLVQGGKGFLIYFPLYKNNEFNGFIVAVFRATEWLDYIFSSTEDPKQFDFYKVSIALDETPIYRHKDFDDYPESNLDIIQSLIINGHRFSIHCRPSQTFIESEKTFIPEIATTFGFLMSILLSVMAFLLLKANNESGKLNVVKKNLEDEIKIKQEIEDHLKQASARLSLATQIGKIGIWNWDIKNDELTWDEIMHDIYDVPFEVKLDHDIWKNSLHHEDQERVLKLLDDTLKNKTFFDTEFQIRTSNDKTKNIHAAAKVERDSAGNPINMIGVNWDISNLNSLKKQTEMQKILMDVSTKYINTPLNEVDSAISDALCEIGNFVSADRAYVFDYDFINQTTSNTHEWCNKGVTPHILELQQLPLKGLSDWVNTHQKGLPMIIPDVNCLPDGQLKEMLVPQKIKSLITFPMQLEGETIGFIGFDWVFNYNSCSDQQTNLLKLFSQILVNIRTRVSSEKELLESRNRLDLALSGTKAGLWDWEIQTGKVIFNERWAEIIGYSLKELEPISIQTWMDFCHPNDLKQSNEIIKNHFEGKTELYDCEARMKHKNGEWVWVLDRGKVVERDKNNKPIRMIGTHIDITERKQLETLKEDIERIMHHDLKNPLNNIMMLQRILSNSQNLNDEEKKAVKYTEIAGHQMQRMLDTHLDLFKIETGSYQFNPAQINVVELINKIIGEESIASDISSSDIQIFINNAPPSTGNPIYINGEEHLCYNIFSNLLTNAKEAPNKNDVISIFINESETTDIIIQNDAPVPEKVRENFFDKYRTEGKRSGTGLGTYSAKLLAEIQNATISMKTSETEGTVITVSFPKI